MNLSLALRKILAQPGEITRSGISQITGITRATISRLVDELISADLVMELEPPNGKRGRPANRLTPAPGRATALGLEVNVSAINLSLIDLGGDELGSRHIQGNFTGSDPIATMELLAEQAQSLLDDVLPGDALFLGSGLGLPGLVSPTALALAPNLGWRDIPLSTLLAPLESIYPAIVTNEADLAAFAVANPRPGVPAGPASFIYVAGEVGIGSGIVNNHAPMSGAHGWSGEIGHVCTDPAGPLCSCGATGCLETYLGLRALTQRAGLERTATVEQLVASARASEPHTLAALEEAGTALGIALSSVINAMDIPLVLLGGIVGELGEWLIEPARAEMDVRVLQTPWSRPSIEIVPDSASLSVRGAAHRILQKLVDDPMAWTA